MSFDTRELKLVLVGQTSVGKTCIVKKTTTGSFSEDSVPTLGASYVSKLVTIGSVDVRLQIWDTAGQEKYRGMTPMYYRGAQVALLVYCINDKSSFEGIDGWLTSLRDNADPDIILFLVGNKCDLELSRAVTTEEGQNKADLINAHFHEVSAKSGQGIEDLFAEIPKLFLEKQQPNEPVNQNGLKLEAGDKRGDKKSCC